jgi:LPS sulfotransferase NodH
MDNFIITHFHRAGSSYLQNLLASHKDIICYFRPFGSDLYGHYDSKKKYLHDIYALDDERLAKMKDSALYNSKFDYIKDNINNAETILDLCYTDNKTIGVKFSFDEFTNHKKLFSHIGLKKIIILERKNLLRQVYSYYKALDGDLDDWFIYEHENKIIEKKIYKFSYMWLLDKFQIIERYYNSYYRLLQPHLKIYYEDLVNDTKKELSKVFDYIGVEDYEYEAKVPVIQNKYHMSEVIENFDELKEKFKDTKYYEFFE